MCVFCCNVMFSLCFELLPRVELGTSSLPRMRSTTELKQQHFFTLFLLIQFRAEDGAQTRDPQLGRLVLYRLSYFRMFCEAIAPHVLVQDVGGDGFEPPKA